MYYASEVAASNVVQIKTADRTATHTHQPSGPVIERGASLNPFFFPSNPPRSRFDYATVVALVFIVLTCAVGIAIADAVFR